MRVQLHTLDGIHAFTCMRTYAYACMQQSRKRTHLPFVARRGVEVGGEVLREVAVGGEAEDELLRLHAPAAVHAQLGEGEKGSKGKKKTTRPTNKGSARQATSVGHNEGRCVRE